MNDTNTPGTVTLPEISQLEANRLAFLAGAAAEKEARAKGISDAEAATLLDAASGGVVIAGMQFPPLHPAFILMQDRMRAFAEKKTIFNHPSADCAATAFILKEPKLAWQLLNNKAADAVEVFYETITEFGLHFTAADFKKLFEWVALESQRLHATGDEAGKPAAA